MCNICQDWENGKMTNQEALNAVGEMIDTSNDGKSVEHYLDLADKIIDKDIKDGPYES